MGVCSSAGTKTSRYYGERMTLLSKYAWYSSNSPDSLSSVGRLKPNDYGLFDIIGNASEWTQEPMPDLHHGIRMGVSPDPDHQAIRGRRGGDFTSLPFGLRSARYATYIMIGRNPAIGFRVVRSTRTM